LSRFAVNEREHLAALLIHAQQFRAAMKMLAFEMLQKRVNCMTGTTRMPSHSIANAHNAGVYVFTRQGYLLLAHAGKLTRSLRILRVQGLPKGEMIK
jgi:hypothetical protein